MNQDNYWAKEARKRNIPVVSAYSCRSVVELRVLVGHFSTQISRDFFGKYMLMKKTYLRKQVRSDKASSELVIVTEFGRIFYEF